MAVKTVPIDSLTIHPQYFRSKSDRSALLLDIAEKGLKKPLDVTRREDGYFIIDGVCRYKCCQDLGYKEIRIRVLNE